MESARRLDSGKGTLIGRWERCVDWSAENEGFLDLTAEASFQFSLKGTLIGQRERHADWSVEKARADWSVEKSR